MFSKQRKIIILCKKRINMSLPKFIPALLISIFFCNYSIAQNCSSLISVNKKLGTTHLLKSINQTLVVRGNYTYSMELVNDEKGISASFVSKNGVDLNEGDEVIFMDKSKARKSYRFIGMGEITNKRGTPTQKNILELDLAAVNWLATTTINTIYIKNNISNRMIKFTVNTNRQTEFKSLCSCFNNTLDKSQVNNTVLTGNDFSPSGGGSAGNVSATRPTGGSNRVQRITDPSLLNDDELKALRKELAETKQKVREEIQAEKDKADRAKVKFQEEVASAREKAAQQKSEYANEVLEARKKANEEIEKGKQQVASSVGDARDKASGEIEKINLSVVEAKQKASEEIQKAQLESASEVANAREKAANQIKLDKKLRT